MASGSRTFWWIAPLLCAAPGAGLGLWLYYGCRMPMRICMAEAIIASTLVFGSAIAVCLLIFAYPTKVGLVAYAVVAALLIAALDAWLHGVISALANGSEYGWWIHTTLPYRAIIYPAFLLLLSVSMAMQRRVRELESRYALQQDAAALLKEAELFKLRQQLQPHFLFNSLNAISSLLIASPQKAEEMIIRLSDFLRASVKQGRSELVPLEEEFSYLRNYLWIETARFGERLQVAWNGLEALPALSSAEMSRLCLPPFLLQPLLENAIKFGVYGQTGQVTISVSVALGDGLLRIAVSNPYDDAGMKGAEGTGFGIEGIRRRLYLMYARQDLLRTKVEDSIFTATLLIPQ